MSWRMRVVHTTGYAYDAPVTSSYNEARLTPRGDTRQTVILTASKPSRQRVPIGTPITGAPR